LKICEIPHKVISKGKQPQRARLCVCCVLRGVWCAMCAAAIRIH